MFFLFDHNVMAPLCANVGGLVEMADLRNSYRDKSLQVLRGLTNGQFRVVVSETCQATLEHTLQKSTASDFEGLDASTAHATIQVLNQVAVNSGGALITEDEVHEFVNIAGNALPPHLVGTQRGQVDYEDLTILATAMATVARHDTSVTIVTNDKGLLNCGPYLSRRGVHLVPGNRFTSLVGETAMAA